MDEDDIWNTDILTFSEISEKWKVMTLMRSLTFRITKMRMINPQ